MSEQIYWLLARGWQGFCNDPATWMQVIILAITAAVVIYYTYQTRRLAESTERLAGEAPLEHALWIKRLECYCHTTYLFHNFFYSLRNRPATDWATRFDELGKELSRVMVLSSGSNKDPVLIYIANYIRTYPDPGALLQITPEEAVKLVNDWVTAVRESLELPKYDPAFVMIPQPPVA